MKKVPVRDFQRHFARQTKTLKPGDVVQVTKDGQPLLHVTKLGRWQIPTPDFARRVASHPYQAKQGEALLALLDETLP